MTAQVPSVLAEPGQLNLAWPSSGEAAVAVEGVGLLGRAGSNSPQPIASLAKLMTAYLVLKAHPLGLYGNGPTITFTQADVNLYNKFKAEGQSVAPVAAGEHLSERQALEALLLPSANNIAVKLGEWVAGSQAKFVQLMNRTARQLGMTHTHYADTSGVSPNTQSTALDQVKIAELDMKSPIFRDIVAKPQATLPVAGTVYNVNADLGKDGVIGIKTGSTSQAGGCWVFAGTDTVNGKPVLIIGAVLGQPPTGPNNSILYTALTTGTALLNSTRSVLNMHTWVTPNEVVAVVHAPWASPIPVTVTSSVTTVAWPGMTAHLELVAHLPKSTAIAKGQKLGLLKVATVGGSTSIPVVTRGSLAGPGLRWRLARG
jgi:D-alanyl-D-alanine carboxypeptidase (penicillin-binding protein 5/6)